MFTSLVPTTSQVPSMGIQPKTGGWFLLVGPHSLNATLLTLISRLGEGVSVRVLDGGNRFNAYNVARQAGGRPEVLNRITVSRLHLLPGALAAGKHPASASPFVVLDLLNTFYDESVQAAERKRLLRGCIANLHRLEQKSGGAVSVHPPAVPSPVAVELLEMLQQAALDTYYDQPVPATPGPMRLF